jgi:hypothetical protein
VLLIGPAFHQCCRGAVVDGDVTVSMGLGRPPGHIGWYSTEALLTTAQVDPIKAPLPQWQSNGLLMLFRPSLPLAA